jgi:hypothetical protein
MVKRKPLEGRGKDSGEVFHEFVSGVPRPPSSGHRSSRGRRRAGVGDFDIHVAHHAGGSSRRSSVIGNLRTRMPVACQTVTVTVHLIAVASRAAKGRQ